MESKYKYVSKVALSALFGLLVTFSAEAQRGGGGRPSAGGGGGGGGSVSRGGGGGGFSGGRGGGMSMPSGGSVSRGGGGMSSRPSPSVGYTPQQRTQQAYGGRGGAVSSAPQSRVYSNNGQAYGNRGGGAIPGRVYGNYSSRTNGGAIPGRVYTNRGYITRGYGYSVPRNAYRNGYFYGSFYNGIYSPYNRFYGRSAFYNQFYYPRIGISIGVLPYGYYPFWWGDMQYYYSDGYYYRQQDNNYTVVEPPMGAIMDQLPAGAKSLMIDGEQYYELNGIYYQAVTKQDGTTGYQIAGKDGELTTAASVQSPGMYDDQDTNGSNQAPVVKIGDVFDSLPPNTTPIKIDGKRYYITPDGIYYQEENNAGRKAYRVVGTSEDQPR
ncbi:DUF6515 family protein [Mucilaginibacter myungsuensis]|uniref:Uncharacterized protein n=1 Tax=Mucilaginibacter myungsuensis TaxID=649104 RepID=A0A929L2U6_9SPHI|nr:DUF6515 family protein [Mucilaginibacter myungsuensis]MBE9662206.1 hypothetical protein [Mucilaginibacter myungsuensis]MDN3599360.1 DUF6515 family protein [Mucilaginibacter myungsuensis]